MPRSVKTRLAEIRKLEEKAARDLSRARAEKDRLMAPTRNKIRDILFERLDLFLRENFELVVGRGIDRQALAKAIDALLATHLGQGSPIQADDEDEDEDTVDEQEDDALLEAFASSGAAVSSQAAEHGEERAGS